MRRMLLLFATTGLLAVGLSAVGVTAASAAKCKCKRGPRGFRGFRGFSGAAGPAGPTGATGATGPAGGGGGGGGVGNGSLQSFTAAVPFNGFEVVTIGSFTLRESAGAAACTNPRITDNSAFAGFLAKQQAGAWGALAVATPTDVAAAETGNNTFSAILVNGSSEVSGLVSTKTVGSASACITAGYMTGV